MNQDRQEPPPSIIAGIEPFPWSDARSIDYEVALDTIGRAIGAFTQRLWDERAKPSPDPAAIQHWQDARSRCVRVQQDLRAQDSEQVAEAIREYGRLVRELRDRAT